MGDLESSVGDIHDLSSQQGVGIGGFTVGNFTVLGRGSCEKRLADSSLEPRLTRKKTRCEGV